MGARPVLSKTVLKRISPAVVQVVALHPGKPGNLDAAWSGSGTLVHPQGYILTSYQVTDPRRVGAKALPAGALAVAVARQADQPPALDESNALLAEKSALLKLKMPSAADRGRMNNRLKALALLRERVGGQLLVEGWIEGPCAEAADLVPGIRTVAVKKGLSRHCAVAIPPERARAMIRRAS